MCIAQPRAMFDIWTQDSESTACVITAGRACIFSRCELCLRHVPAQTHHKTFIKQSHCKMTLDDRWLSMLPTSTTSCCDRAIILTVLWLDANMAGANDFKVVGSFNLTTQKKTETLIKCHFVVTIKHTHVATKPQIHLRAFIVQKSRPLSAV